MDLLKKMVVSVGVLFLAVWVLWYGISLRAIENSIKSRTPTSKAGKYFPRALYNKGVIALNTNSPAQAVSCFQEAVSKNVLYMNAWLKLARAEVQLGDRETAAHILRFSDQVTQNTVKWKWQQILLAEELADEDIFLKNINFVISDPQLQKDALFLIDMHYKQDTARIIERVQSKNLIFYLEWLMKWRRVVDSESVWRNLTESAKREDRFYERYAQFLFRQKEIKKAAEIWKTYTGISGISNPGFEDAEPRNLFDWSNLNKKNDHWYIRQVKSNPKSGEYALEISFFGSENFNFSHLSQVVPVLPGKNYRLTYWWRSNNITTDQRPFMELSGYGCKSLNVRSEMIPANSKWHQQVIHFTVPERCEAIIIRIRRLPSYKFDCKIKGSLWLDDFHLEETGADS